MAEHADWFLWNRSPAAERSGDDDYALDPDVLGVSPELTERLTAWNDQYPLEKDVTAAWGREGRALTQPLQREFDARGVAVVVLFHDDEDQSELPVETGD